MDLPFFLISPPFGNWISRPNCVSVKGSFTLERRPGLIPQIIKTLRPVKGGWRNKIGLRNPGIRNVKFDPRHIYSVVALDGEWVELTEATPEWATLEINLGCPNVHGYTIDQETLNRVAARQQVIAKLPPTPDCLSLIEMCMKAGVHAVHLSNTLPTLDGGISGAMLRQVNIPLVVDARMHFRNARIIAGGGVYTVKDIIAYRMAGANHISLSTVWFNPFKASRLVKYGA